MPIKNSLKDEKALFFSAKYFLTIHFQSKRTKHLSFKKPDALNAFPLYLGLQTSS